MRIPSDMDYKTDRIVNGWIAIVALGWCAITGSWVAAFIAVAFGVVDSSASRALELWHYRISKEAK